ncbi:hypothetical protein BCR34DRAFT_646719 [Clohesyomyces aquaticus]|uniref:NAD(P)-binding protein n=1 Tax=Clohesyomyces aquaticus TaxID=1231657 RepID=A0A1Y1ZVQ5_9PLEO|nr:hypothetical protein BCR34DRAFT_646719 [Clohesyomyces aquaticus]
MTFLYLMLRSQLFITLPTPSSDFSKQTIMITGADSGLGLEASRYLFWLETHVIFAVRNEERGLAAAENLTSSTGAEKAKVSVWHLSLTSQASRLDTAIQNAAMDNGSWLALTRDGFEKNLAVNVINPAFLGRLVLPKLRQSAVENGVVGRLELVGPALFRLFKFEEQNSHGKLLEALNCPETSIMEDRELANAMPFSEKSPVVITYVTPGSCDAGIVRKDDSSEHTLIGGLIKSVAMAVLARTSEQGSRTLVDAVRPDVLKESHGAYLRDC